MTELSITYNKLLEYYMTCKIVIIINYMLLTSSFIANSANSHQSYQSHLTSPTNIIITRPASLHPHVLTAPPRLNPRVLPILPGCGGGCKRKGEGKRKSDCCCYVKKKNDRSHLGALGQPPTTSQCHISPGCLATWLRGWPLLHL